MIAMRKLAFAGAGVIVIGAGAAATVHYRPDRAMTVATEFVAHMLCSATFVSGFDPDQFYREALEPLRGIRVLDHGIQYNVDKLRREVTVNFVNTLEGYAVFRGETGCIIGHEDEYIPPIMDMTKNEAVTPLLPDIAGDQVVEPSDPKLKAALDRAFAEPDHPPHRYTKAIVVLHDGKIIAERYAPEIKMDTRLYGEAVSTSLVNAMIGVLVRQGKLTTDGPAPVDDWKETSDPRHVISIENLMRMTSGLDLKQTNSGFDRGSQILTLEGDMAGAAARAELIALPGMRWAYSGPSTILLSRIVKNKVGQPENVLQFARRELFGPLGMKNMTLEFDGAGTPVGSSFFFGSARDWARFGQLYLNDGVVGDKRILPEGWVKWSATPTVEADVGYGAGFWTNRGDSRGARARVKEGMPNDSFFASGNLGQRVIIVPSANLVVVRFGNSRDYPNFDVQGTTRLVSDVIAALRAP